MTKSFQNSKVNLVAPIKYLEVILAIIIGFFYFNENYTIFTLAGVMLILIGIVSNFYFSFKSPSKSFNIVKFNYDVSRNKKGDRIFWIQSSFS